MSSRKPGDVAPIEINMVVNSNDGLYFLRPIMRTITVALVAVACCSSASAAPADEPPQWVPLGVYLSWERTAACARALNVDRWDDVCRRLDVVAANHVDTLWVTNMADADLPRLIRECEKRGIKLVASMSTIEAKIPWRWANDGKYYEETVPRVVRLAGDSKALIGWVLSDEPKAEMLPRVEQLRKRFRDVDPNRFCLVVSMWPQTPLVPTQTNLPVVCVDLYPFFGPKDPNGPHTDAASRAFFRKNAARMVEAIGEKNAVPWIMGMCFSDIWGPRRYDSRWHLVGLPGSYLHWRCPSPAEMRWQVWETLRSQCRGILIYTLAPEAPDPATAGLPPPDVAWKDVLAKEATDLGPNALTNPDCSPTPQLVELGRIYSLIGPHKSLIRRWRVTAPPFATVTAPGQIECFTDPTSGRRYALVVNDDLHQAQVVQVRLVGETGHLVDILSNQSLENKDGAFQLRFRPGDGAILEVIAKAGP